MWDALAWRKNCWLSPLLPPSSTSPDPGDGVLRSKFNFFPVQHHHNPTPPKIFVPGYHARIQEFFVRGGSRLLNLFYSLKRGSNDFITHFPGGGGPTFSRGGGPIETHITITCDFPGGGGGGGGGLDPLSPSGSAHGHCGFLAGIGSDEPVWPPFKLRNSKC